MFSGLGTLAAVVFLATISPGPDFIAVSSAALANRASAIKMAAGIAAAVFVWATFTALGFGLVMQSMPALFDGIRIIGGAYLIYIGFRIVRSILDDSPGEYVNAGSVRAPFRRGFIVSITNPKTAAFFGSLFFTVLPTNAPLITYVVAVFLVSAITASWMLVVAVVFSGSVVNLFYCRLQKPISAFMGTALILLGVRLVVTR